MAYVITDTCIKDQLVRMYVPPTASIQKRTSPASKKRHRCMWIRTAALIAEPAYLCARQTRSTLWMTCLKEKKSLLGRMLLFTAPEPR